MVKGYKLLLILVFGFLFTGCTLTNLAVMDEPNTDTFHRQRISSPFTLFEDKSTYGINTAVWDKIINGSNTTIESLINESAISLKIGTGNGDVAIRQTRRYFYYSPSKSHLVTMVGAFEDPKTNLIQRLGYFDAENGLFFQLNGSNLSVVLRGSITGVINDTIIDRGDWNIDRLDGLGLTGFNLTISDMNIFVIDFENIGTGRIRFGFIFRDQIAYVHEVRTSNTGSSLFLSKSSLPLRYEIRNIGVTSSPSMLKQTYSSIVSEGEPLLEQFEFSVSNGVNIRTFSSRQPILAIRLNSTYKGIDNRRTIRLVRNQYYAEDEFVFFELVRMHNITSFTGTWQDVGSGSAAQFSDDLTAISAEVEVQMQSLFVPAGGAGNQAFPEVNTGNLDFINMHSFISQNINSDASDVYVVFAIPLTGAPSASISFDWVEFE